MSRGCGKVNVFCWLVTVCCVFGLLRDAWALAIETLSWMDMRKLSERLAFTRTVKQLGIHDSDALRLALMLVLETVKRRNLIDKFISTILKPSSLEEFDLGVQAFLRLYVYQTRLANSRTETVNFEEAENIAKLARSILGWKTLQEVEPFLGLLLTQKISTVLDNASDEERIGLLTFHPTWFVKYCFRIFGRTETITMFEADKRALPTYIRLNTLKTDENTIMQKLAEEGVKTEKTEQLKFAHKVIQTKTPLTKTESHKQGLFYIQDKASCFAAEAADPKPKTTVLDVCAAPGAKTTYLAQLMQNQGTIISLDYSRRRMSVWKDETRHMDTANAEPIIANACKPLPFQTEADLVILDPPCTSTGTFARLPSSKWRITPRSIDRMAAIQWQMLNNCTNHVKQDGTLIYSTCSITVEENEIQIERFLKHHSDFQLVPITPKIGVSGMRGLDICQRLYSHLHECNGFFIAKLQRE